MLLRGLNS